MSPPRRAGTSPGAPAAEPSAGCPWRTPSRASMLRSAAWTCCWSVSAVRSADTHVTTQQQSDQDIFSVSFCTTAGLSRFPSWCLGLQHRHDPHHPSRLWSVSLQDFRVWLVFWTLNRLCVSQSCPGRVFQGFGSWRCLGTSHMRSIMESTCPTNRCSPPAVGLNQHNQGFTEVCLICPPGSGPGHHL